MKKIILFTIVTSLFLANAPLHAQTVDSAEMVKSQKVIAENLKEADKHQRKIKRSQKKIDRQQKKIKRQERRRERKMRKIQKEQKKVNDQ